MGRALIVAVVGSVGLYAADLEIDPQEVIEAVALGQSTSEADRQRFHRPYRIDLASPPIDSIDIVTPFRRVVIAAEERARAGDRRFGQRDGLAVLGRYPRQISVHAELTFHPQNTFVLVPRYQVRWITAGGARVEPAFADVAPRYAPRLGSTGLPALATGGTAPTPALPGRSQPMLGASVAAFFDGVELLRPEDPAREVAIEEAGRELARLPIDLARLR